VIGHKAIVTISLREANVLETFKNNRVRDFLTGYRTRFAFQILHAVAKDFLKYLRFIDKTLDSTERQLTKSVTNKELFKLMELGKSLVYFSTSIKSNEGVLERLMRGKSIKQYEEDQDLLEDVIIENRQAMEMAGTYASIINGTMDANASIISNNLNVVMKFLAAITIVFSIPTIVSSMFGMNIPLPTQAGFLDDPWQFAIVLGVILLVGGVVAWWMHKRDML
jgi:magnesium transporter